MSLRIFYHQIRDFWNRYRRIPTALVGLIVVFSIVVLGLVGSGLSPHDPLEVAVGGPLRPPSLNFIMGTDDLGRDIFSGVLNGITISLAVGLAAAGTATAIGLLVGIVSGFYSGVDLVLMKIVEIFQVIPTFFLAIMISAIFGSSIINIIFIIAILSWPSIAKIARGEVLSLKEHEFVTAARSCGYSNINILFDEVLPNVLSSVVVAGTLAVSRAILIESTLSFFGFGDPMTMSLGYMLANANKLLRFAWWPAVFPGVVLSLIIWGLTMIGNGLNSTLNPRLHKKSIIIL